MSKYVVVDSDQTLRFDFIVDGQNVEPTSAYYTVTKNDYTVVNSLEDETITLTPGNTYVNILIPGSANAVTLVNELRYVTLKFIYQGNTYTQYQYYYLVDNIVFPLSYDEIRAVIGVSQAEVPDNMIDILSAYKTVASEVTVNVETILTTGTVLLSHLIAAVKYKAALDISIGIETSIYQSEQADNTLYTRFQTIDFDRLRQDLASRYDAALNKLDSIEAGTTVRVYATTAVGTDAVTGA